MSYIIKLKTGDLALCGGDDPYAFSLQLPAHELFARARYAHLGYYRKKTSRIELVQDNASQVPISRISADSVCIIQSRGTIRTRLLNAFRSKGGKLVYVNETLAQTDIERAWWTIRQHVDFSTTKKVSFSFSDPSKLVFAYRAHTCFGVEISDLTY